MATPLFTRYKSCFDNVSLGFENGLFKELLQITSIFAFSFDLCHCVLKTESLSLNTIIYFHGTYS